MRKWILMALGLTVPVLASAQTRIDSINTNFHFLGPDDKIVIATMKLA